jgi:glycosyltransferase involved in cell wall biosynthesis
MATFPNGSYREVADVPVTAVILTRNEELAIERCVRALARCRQVIVVDSHSEDGTAKLAEAAGAEVVDFQWNGRYPKKKQWSLENLAFTEDWVLFVDADEIATGALLDEIRDTLNRPRPLEAYDVALAYSFLGRRLRFGRKVVKRVLLRIGSASFPEVDDLDVASMWEVEGHYQPQVRGRVGRLRNVLIHEDPDPLFQYFERHNRYSDWEAHLRVKEARDPLSAGIPTRNGRLSRRMPGKPILFFLYSYVFRLGFLDGRAGLAYGVSGLFYYCQIYWKSLELRTGRQP